MDGKSIHFLDNSIAKIDPENGYIKYVKSCAEMLRDNGLEHLILRSGELHKTPCISMMWNPHCSVGRILIRGICS